MRNLFIYLFAFIVVLLLQEFVFGSINLLGYVSIYGYGIVLVMLPMQTRPAPLMLSALAMGAIFDMFAGSPALIAMSMVFIAFVRPAILKLTIEAEVVAGGGVPFSSRVGSSGFVKYVFLMVLLFSLTYSTLEVMTFTWVVDTLIKVGLSTVATTIFIYVAQLPFGGRRKKI